MRVTNAAFLFLAISLAAVAQNRPALDPEQTRILTLETAWNRAEEQKDAKALDGLLDSTLLYIDYDGTLMNKAQFLASVKAPLSGTNCQRIDDGTDVWLDRDRDWRRSDGEQRGSRQYAPHHAGRERSFRPRHGYFARRA